MRTRYKIDADTRMIIVRYIRKYDEYARWYQKERERIISESNVEDEKNLFYDSTFEKTAQLEELENSQRKKVLIAIDKAKERLINVFDSQKAGEILADAIIDSCINSRNSFDASYAGLVACERTSFYNYKARFIKDIENALGI